MIAFTHVLTAGSELPWLVSVARVTSTPATLTVVCAVTVDVPVVDDVIVVVHEPPVVSQAAGGLGADVAPTSTVVNVTCVPSGASTSPVPSLTKTVAVKV